MTRAKPSRDPEGPGEVEATRELGSVPRPEGLDQTRLLEPVPRSAPLAGSSRAALGSQHAPGGGVRDPEGPIDAAPLGADDPTLIADRFEVLGVLGDGSMGRVYLAADRQIGRRRVALKVLLPRYSRDKAFRKLFFAETEAVTDLASEYLVQVRDTGILSDGRLFLTMDVVAGQSLQRMLESEGHLATRQALEIARQALLGLASGHDKGYVHRDIKPSNLMLAARVPKTDENPFGVGVRVLDFGLAGLAEKLGGGSTARSALYMSPEQLLGEQLDPRSDLFSIGVVLYEMLAGRRPFGGVTVEGVTTAVLDADIRQLVEQLERFPKPVRRLLRKALAKERSERFQSAADFVRAIEGSRAFRAARGASGWPLALGSLAAAVAVIEAGYIGLLQRAVARAGYGGEPRDVEPQGQPGPGQLGHGQPGHGQPGEDRAQLERAFQEALAEKQREVDDQREELARVEGERKDLAQRVALLEQRLGGSDQERQVLQAAFDEQAQRLVDLRRTAEEWKEDYERLRFQVQDEVEAAATFDTIHAFLAQGNEGGALEAVDRIQLDTDLLLHPSKDAGGEVILDLVRGLHAFREFEAESGFDPASLSEAQACLARVRTSMERFEVRAKNWLEQPSELGEASPRRREQVRELLRALTTKLASVEELKAGKHAEDAQLLLADPLQADPERAIDHVRLFGCDHFAELVEGIADAIERRCVADGHLLREALRGFPGLSAWGAVLLRGEVELDPDPRDTIIHAWYARAWYLDGRLPEDAQVGGAPLALPRLVEQRPRRDWKAVLALQQALARQAARGLCPLVAADRLVFREQELERGRELWISDECAPGGGPGGAWEVSRVVYSGVQASAVSLSVQLAGRRVMRGNQEIVDLGATGERSDLGVVGWRGSEVGPLPRRSGFPDPAGLEAFRHSLESEPIPCLVVESGETTYWISPEVGLVLEHRPDRHRLDLAYVERR